MPGSTLGGQITPPPWSSFSLSVFDESPGSEQGFCPAFGACAQASEMPASVSASAIPYRAMTALTPG
jgi:hypothetical protein